MFQDIAIEELMAAYNNKEITLIDVRSPSEYKDSTIPGSMNIPLFNDEERAEVGTIYKQESSDKAKERGLEIFSAKLPQFIKTFSAIEGPKAVFCWRGGMRSRTAATVLDLMGIRAKRLQGGFRTYRQWIVKQLGEMDFTPQAYVLHGNTGTGKTLILNELAKQGYPVLDLEGLAGHRGSIFGEIGLEPNNQKMFESLLFHDLDKLNASPYILMEAESKRVGKVVLPDFVTQKKQQGLHIFIDMPVSERVNHILEDYLPWEHREECLEAFKRIKRRIHTPIAGRIEEDLESGNYHSAVRLLLEHYYDPRYEFHENNYDENQRINLQVQNSSEAIVKIKEIIKKRQPAHTVL
ncbi:tRNA 2-selenouridine(34) synthase MnmH [Fictibacillus fluitans]|uniref:tRNA 2-selenouridine(34) synthase MnmH n=1 Tax=Fictibacillus fluitans TaxID=3058422 RepID=A0ABT8HZ40_9BACL|nr:tRNA 2-selenouridine(34) synthase MnmH [Fictibacillus sp. NE201]MDN4526038.1 tRNA 2-selenouridine(34) synthase MnmH [Fictibacillus sp. NE201]